MADLCVFAKLVSMYTKQSITQLLLSSKSFLKAKKLEKTYLSPSEVV